MAKMRECALARPRAMGDHRGVNAQFARPLAALLALAAWSAFLPSHAQTDAQYRLREPEPRTGTRITREIVSGSRLPLDKRYEELSPEDKAALNSVYENMGPGDEPPFPAQGLRPFYEAVAQAQQRLLATGELALVATVAADGQVAAVKAIGSPKPEMTKAASTILLLTRFKPALCKGIPCRMDYAFHFVFARE